MNKLIKAAAKAAVIAAAGTLILAAVPAYAKAEAASLNAVNNNGTVTIEQREGMSENLIVTCFDKDGILTYASAVSAESGQYTFSVQGTYSSVKAFDINKEVYNISITETTEITASPDPAEQTPNPTAAVSETAVPSATRKPINPSYQEEIDQATAPGLIKKVEYSSLESGEPIYKLTVLIQGVEAEVAVETDRVIEKAPAVYSDLMGEDASVLRRGDVVYFRTDISGRYVRGLELIYRPSDILQGSANYSEFFTGGSIAHKAEFGSRISSERTYALGIITDKNNGILTLYSGDGIADKAMEIEYTKDTVTYICELSSREEPYIASSSEISKSSIPKRSYDDDDNITYSDDDEYRIALVRLIDRTAVDIVVYE
ncbi:MAG: hypothetical protein Q4G33_07205 [bacterium]|nr:hypothetical protein [bacterium]